MPETNPHTPAERRLFIAILLLLVWMPIPLGSNRLWSESLVILWLCSLGILYIVTRFRSDTGFSATPALARARPVLWAFAGLLGWHWLQLVEMPLDLLARVSPRAAEIWTWPPDYRPGDWGTISLDPYETALSARQTLAWLVLFVLLLQLVQTTQHVRAVALALLVSGGLQAAYGSIVTLANIEIYPISGNRGVASGTFMNRNHLASYLYLCLAVGIGWLIADTRRRSGGTHWRARLRNLAKLLLSPKARVRLLLCIMVIALVLTRSRMGNTAFFFSFGLAGLLALWLQWKHVTRGIVVLFVSLVLLDIAIVGNWFGIEQVAERIQKTTAETELRDTSFQDTLVLLEDFWVTGSGAGSFRAVFPAYQSPEHVVILQHVHNDYLEIAANLGVIGLALFAFIVLHALFTSIRAQRERNHALMRGMAFATTMSIIALLIHSTVEFNLQIPAIAGTIVTILALGYIAAAMPVEGRRRRRYAVQPLMTDFPDAPAERPEPGIV